MARGARRGSVAQLQRAVMGHRMVADAARRGEPDLRAFLLAHGVNLAGCRRLEAIGVPGKFVCALGARIAIGQALVHLSRDGSRWDEQGPTARLLLACHDEAGLIDIAAVSTSHPDEVALRTGAGWCLGFDHLEAVERAVLAERRAVLRLVSDPIEWLRAGAVPSGSGAVGQTSSAVCVLDWKAALVRLRQLGESATIECDAGAGEQLRARLKHGGLPRVKERAPAPRERRAA